MNEVRERGSLNEFEEERFDSGALFKSVDGRDVGMIERGQELRFALQPQQTVGVVHPPFAEDFDGNITL